MYRPEEIVIKANGDPTGKIRDAGESGWFFFCLSKHPIGGGVNSVTFDNSDDGSGDTLAYWQINNANSASSEIIKYPVRYTDGLYITFASSITTPSVEVAVYLWPGLDEFPRN